MANLEEITEMSREDRAEEPVQSPSKDPSTRTARDVERKRKNAGDVGDSGRNSPSGQDRRDLKLDGDGEQVEQPAIGQKKDPPPITEDVRGKFYEHYRKDAEEYDKEFLKKYDEDLNTTLIFAGLFSAVTSAFIIEVNSELQPDLNDETAALLRVLIYKVDNTTFGNDVPALPQWTGPPRTIVQVQAILFASLAASFLSAFLAMLGKQWLNRYMSVDMRGSAIERSQNRQRKLDGIVSWYFDYVMESLPMMLQVALLLLGCALSRYFWDINTTVASVVLGVTSFGFLFYLYVVVEGAASPSCPYQTPPARILRGIPHILRVLRSIIIPLIEGSECYSCFNDVIGVWKRGGLLVPIIDSLLSIVFIPFFLGIDVFSIITRATRSSIKFIRLHFQSEEKTAVLDLHCVSWTLQTSLDGPVRLSAMNYLATMTLPDFDPTLVAHCFNVLFGCVKIINGSVVINQGSEKLAAVSTLCCLHTLSHLKAAYPLSRSLEAIRQQYTRVFQSETNFDSLPFSHTLGAIHRVFYPTHPGRTHYLREEVQETLYTWSVGGVQQIRWENYTPPSDEHVVVARALARLARFESWRRSGWKAPRWLVGFAVHFLLQDPLPPAPVVISCLTIITIDLGCDVPKTMTSDNRCMEEVSNLITQQLETMVELAPWGPIMSRRKTIIALLPYTIRLGQSGKQRIVDRSLRAAMALGSETLIWDRAKPPIARLFNAQSPPSLDWLITLASPYVSWHDEPYDGEMVVRWVAAVSGVSSGVPYTEEIGQSVVGTLLHIASVDALRPRIPVDIWACLMAQPSLPPECLGRSRGSSRDVLLQIRALGDIEILKSYLLLIWSEWDSIDDQQSGGLVEMTASIREDFGGIEMWRHRQDLIGRLDHVLGQLDKGLDHLHQHKPGLDAHHISRAKTQYSELKGVLLEVDVEATDGLSEYHSTFVCALPPPCP